MSNLTFQSLGLLKLLFANKITLSEEDSIPLTNFMHSLSGLWTLFQKFLMDPGFKIRKEALLYVPQTGYFFRKSFIKLLREGSGDCFAKLPLSFREEVIGICTYASCEDVL